jgi:hypothetical protein
MKYNNTIEILKSIRAAIEDPTIIADKLGITEMFQFPSNATSNNSMNSNVYTEPEDSNIEYNKNVPMENSKSYNYDESNGYNKKDTSSNPQGVIDSIAQELTSARLQQAIILSEIVGKPRSKTRKKRRF